MVNTQTKYIAFLQYKSYNNSAGRNTLYTRVTELTFKRYVISSATRSPQGDFLFFRGNELYEYIIDECKKKIDKVETGVFGADMKVNLINDGPFTMVIDSEELL